MNRFFKIGLIILTSLLVVFLVVREVIIPKLFSWGDPFAFNNIVLIDSLKINNLETLYWFKYEGGISTSTVSYMAVSDNPCGISKDNAIIAGDLIYRIDTVRNDTIFIISRLGFTVLRQNSTYKFINEDFSYYKKHKPKHLKEQVFLSKICNSK
ncbi:MAG: hypothetical protein EPN39_21190 [Chitinophagaceae bacterium]|nr:MAG: hypothetical protein EPN39_21190 [Chitinophagaceae bacterium]